MLSGKAIFFSSLETLPADNKDIQIYAEKQAKHFTFSSLLVWKKVPSQNLLWKKVSFLKI